MKNFYAPILCLFSAAMIGFTSCSKDSTDKGTDPNVYLSEKIIPVDGSGVTDYVVDVDADQPWDIVSEEDWLSVEKKTDFFLLSVDPTSLKTSRSGMAILTCGNKEIEIEIIQDRRRAAIIPISEQGYNVVWISQDCKYILLWDGSSNAVWDTDTDEITDIGGGGGIRIANDGTVCGTISDQAAWYDPATQQWNYIYPGTFSGATGINNDGSIIIGYYAKTVLNPDTGSSNSVYVPFVWENGVSRDLEMINPYTSMLPRSISNDGNLIIGESNNAGTAYIWKNRTLVNLPEGLIDHVHLIDTIVERGIVAPFNIENYSYKSVGRPLHSLDGKKIAGNLSHTEVTPNDDGKTYRTTGNVFNIPFIIDVDSWSLTMLDSYQDHMVMPAGTVNQDGTFFVVHPAGNSYADLRQAWVYDGDKGEIIKFTDWAEDEYGVEVPEYGYVYQMSEDKRKIVFCEYAGIGWKYQIVSLDY